MDFFQINFIIIIIFMLSLSKIHYSRCHLVSNWFGPPTELRWLSLKPLSISLLFVSSTNSKTNDLSLLHFALMLCDSHICTSHQYNCFSGMSLCKYLNFVFESMYLLLSSSISKCLWVFTVQLNVCVQLSILHMIHERRDIQRGGTKRMENENLVVELW